MKFKSITVQISLLFGLLMSVISTGLGLSTYITASNTLADNIDESLLEIAEANAKVITEKINTQFNALEALANNPVVKSSKLTMKDKLEFLQDEVVRCGHKSIMLATTDGTAYNTTGQVVDIKERNYFLEAMSGRNSVTDPLVSKTDGSVVVVFAVPIKNGDTVTGVLAARRDGNELSNYVSEMEFNQREIFMVNNKGTIIASSDQNLVLEMYNIFDEYKANPELEGLYNLVKKMTEGEKGVGEYTYNGAAKYVAYSPVEGTGWSLAVTAPKSVVMSKVSELTWIMGGLSALFLLIGIVLTVIIARGISQPIKETSKYLNVISTGDFTVKISEKLLSKQDEIGILANSLSKMQSSVRSMIKAVIDECTVTGQMLRDINQHMSALNESIEDISYTTQELSAGTEEMAASSEEMNATALEVEKAIGFVASKSQEGAATVNKVNTISEEMKAGAITSRQKAVEIYSKAKADLQNAIERAKAVNKINELSDTILDITSQTNLLALNAAIEAARAGETGKGFAVVADEIRKLAESSKSSASRIQEMTKDVLEAVNTLTLSAAEVMEFIEKRVLNDYEDLVQKSERYNELSSVINDIVAEFSSTAEELMVSMENMVNAINQISASANEEATGAANIAQKTEMIVNMSENVVKLADKSNEKAEALIRLVNQFKI
ncbi:methyl-accepting chemotaxis protein [Thermoclostridium stercorarium]|nr:methyl-accepting chemotaxis protein [Thermoclostridium stercorarium]UZQ86698.1 methyl-accepting chemotaxis protein [Thermoclostridium stercorarium]